IKNDKSFKENQANVFLKEREQYFEIQDLKAQLQDKGVAISELKKLIEKLKGKSVETKFEKSSNAFKSQRQSILGKLAIFSDSLAKKDFSKSKTVTKQNVSNDNQTRTPQLHQDIRKPNKRVSFSTRVIPNTSVSRPQLKSNHLEDRVMSSNSQGKNWWYPKYTPSGYNWKPKSQKGNVNPNISMPLGNASRTANILEHKTPRNLKLLTNFVEKFLGTVKFGNDQIAPILGYGDLVQGTITIKQGNDLLTCSCGTDLYFISLQDSTTPNPICLMAKATSSQAWLWHRRLSHLNFDTINLLSKNNIVNGLPKLKFVKDHLCSSCELGKAKRKSFHTKTTPSSKRRLQLLHMDLCGPMRVESINGKKYVLRTSTQVRTVRTDKGTKFLNKTLHAYFAQEGIEHQKSIARTPKQNAIVERRNRTLVEAARTMLSTAKVPLFFWAEAIATTCFTQNRSLGIPLSQEHHFSSDPVSQCLTTALEHASLSPGPQIQENVPQAAKIVTTSNELDLLFGPIFDQLLNGTTQVVSKSFAVTATDAPNQRQQQHTTPATSITVAADTPPLNIQTTPETTSQAPTQTPIVTATEKFNQPKTNKEYAQVDEDEFINIFNHPLEQVIGNPSQSIRTRRQLEIDGEMCIFALIVSRTEPKNIKEAMADSAWIEAMQEELYQFDRLDVWELVDMPLCTNVINMKWL
ncbi:retrovirus-related pol polyprotein from transposon TNT 1-94, partial [Tanacetum coccineum]